MSSMTRLPPEDEDHPSNLNEQGQEDDSFSLGLDQDNIGPGNLGEEFAAERDPDPNQNNNADLNENSQAGYDNNRNTNPNASDSAFNPHETPPTQQQTGSYPYQPNSQGTPFNPRRRSFFSRPTQPSQQPFGAYPQPPFGSYPQPPFGAYPQPPFGTRPPFSTNPQGPIPSQPNPYGSVPFQPIPTLRASNTTGTTPSSRYNTVSRTEDEMLHVAPIVAKEHRSTLDNKAFQHLRTLATTAPPDTKFILPDPKADEEILQRTQTISNLLDNLRRHLQKYDLIDCFRLVIPTKFNQFGEVIGNDLYLNQQGIIVTIDLLKHYAQIDEPQVLASVTFLRKYGQDYDLQNLDWTNELMINVCDPILSSKINERLAGYSIKSQGGPLFLYLMLQLIISTSEETSKALLSRLDNLKIYQIEGENVLNVVSLVRKAVERLELVHKLPDNILEKLLDIFQTSSIKDFNSLFAAMKMQKTIDERFHVNRFTPEIIFETAQIAYTNFQESNKWIGFGQDKATFFVCHSCGKDGHYANNCPDKVNKKPSTKQQNNTISENTTYKRDGPLCHTPPKDGCRSKMINGKLRFWCHHCGWNAKHGTTKCTGPKKGTRNADANTKKTADNKTGNKKSAKANIAQTPSAPQDSKTSTSTPATAPTDSISSNTSVTFQQPMQQSMMHSPTVPDSIPQPYPPSAHYTMPYFGPRWW